MSIYHYVCGLDLVNITDTNFGSWGHIRGLLLEMLVPLSDQEGKNAESHYKNDPSDDYRCDSRASALPVFFQSKVNFNGRGRNQQADKQQYSHTVKG